MALKKPWVPPPCQSAVSRAWGKDSKAQPPKKQETPVLEVISKELERLESLVDSLDHAFVDLKSQASARIQNETDVEKEQKYICEAFSNMNLWQGEHQRLLKEVLSEMNTINSNLTLALRDSKDNAEAKETRMTSLHRALDFLEKRYKRDVGYLQKRLLSHKLHSRELYFSLRSSNKKLLEKEDAVKSLTELCDELKFSLSKVTNQKNDLQASVEKLQSELASKKESSEAVNIKVPSPRATPNQEIPDAIMRTGKEMQNKINKLEKQNREYQQQLKRLERKLKKFQKKSSQSNAESEKEKCTEVSEASKGTVTSKLKEDLNLQLEQVSLLQSKLQKNNNDMLLLAKENEELKMMHSAEISLLRAELQNTSESESALRSQLQHLKRSYAVVFSDSSFLDA